MFFEIILFMYNLPHNTFTLWYWVFLSVFSPFFFYCYSFTAYQVFIAIKLDSYFSSYEFTQIFFVVTFWHSYWTFWMLEVEINYLSHISLISLGKSLLSHSTIKRHIFVFNIILKILRYLFPHYFWYSYNFEWSHCQPL